MNIDTVFPGADPAFVKLRDNLYIYHAGSIPRYRSADVPTKLTTTIASLFLYRSPKHDDPRADINYPCNFAVRRTSPDCRVRLPSPRLPRLVNSSPYARMSAKFRLFRESCVDGAPAASAYGGDRRFFLLSSRCASCTSLCRVLHQSQLSVSPTDRPTV